MKFVFLITFFILFSTQATSQNNLKSINLTISLSKDTFNSKDDILVKMVLKNNSKKNQRLLFVKPKPSTGGPWWTSASLINVNTGKSVLRYESKAMLSSQLYTEEQLRVAYYVLRPMQSLKGTFSLFDICVVNSSGYYGLDIGTYQLQLIYSNNISNKLIFTVK